MSDMPCRCASLGRCDMPRWNPLVCNEGKWEAGHHTMTDEAPLIFIKLPQGVTTLGRIDKLPFVIIQEMGIEMLINAATPGVLVMPVE